MHGDWQLDDLGGNWPQSLVWFENSITDRKTTTPHLQDHLLQSLLKHQSILNTIKLRIHHYLLLDHYALTTFGLTSFSIIISLSCYICLLHFNMHGYKMPIFIWLQLLMCIHIAAPGRIALSVSDSTAWQSCLRCIMPFIPRTSIQVAMNTAELLVTATRTGQSKVVNCCKLSKNRALLIKRCFTERKRDRLQVNLQGNVKQRNKEQGELVLHVAEAEKQRRQVEVRRVRERWVAHSGTT